MENEMDLEEEFGGVGLVSCTKSKKSRASVPKELYMESNLFKKKRKFCQKYHDRWFILSAEHHLLEPGGPVIEPYEKTLRNSGVREKKKWSEKVIKQIKNRDLLNKKIYIHAGKDYYEYLVPLLEKEETEYEIPTKGLRIGKTLSWYNKRL